MTKKNEAKRKYREEGKIDLSGEVGKTKQVI